MQKKHAVLKPHPYEIDTSWIATSTVRDICANIAKSAGYDVKRPGHRVWVAAYEKKKGQSLWMRVLVEKMYTGEMKQIPSGVKISFYYQRYQSGTCDQPKMWMKAKLFLDDEYGNHHWYVDPQKLIKKLEAAIEYVKSLGI